MTDSPRHRVLVVGVGSIGERHLRCFHTTGRSEVAFCEPNPDLRATIAERYPHAQGFPSLEAAIAGGGSNAAVIATPAPLHIPIATQLAQAGLHLLIEKPLSTTLAGIEQLQEEVARRSLITAVGYTHRAHPAVQALKEVLLSERFGTPRQMTIITGQDFAFARPAYRNIYFADPAQGGGAIQDSITHMYNVGEWLLGPMTRLVTDAAHQALADVTVEDTVHTLARHGSVPATYTCNLYQAPNEATITIVCEQGTIRSEHGECRWSWMTEPFGTWTHQALPRPDRDTMYIVQADAFLDAVEGKRTPLCSLDEGIQTLRVNLASLRSWHERRWEEVA